MPSDQAIVATVSEDGARLDGRTMAVVRDERMVDECHRRRRRRSVAPVTRPGSAVAPTNAAASGATGCRAGRSSTRTSAILAMTHQTASTASPAVGRAGTNTAQAAGRPRRRVHRDRLRGGRRAGWWRPPRATPSAARSGSTSSRSSRRSPTIERGRHRLRCRDVEVLTGDVTEYELPDDVTAVYMSIPSGGRCWIR